MTIIELKNKFIATKQYEPIDANELLDFARQLYLRNELPLGVYRHLVRDLEALGAYKPDDERVKQYSGSAE
ncbi:YppF family protein [Anoxybacillus suryakundensis]|uniref:YppF-like protein n=1 Tax=Anoxybacillus suryakundensis TaxID=1325335 RepID=A0A0K6GL27_9BACL|nr:YppF family protein [Anoxybacillus suryakundensis]CUA79449.1 YppF-like protein [Anoxybacillus suryakundensis]